MKPSPRGHGHRPTSWGITTTTSTSKCQLLGQQVTADRPFVLRSCPIITCPGFSNQGLPLRRLKAQSSCRLAAQQLRWECYGVGLAARDLFRNGRPGSTAPSPWRHLDTSEGLNKARKPFKILTQSSYLLLRNSLSSQPSPISPPK